MEPGTAQQSVAAHIERTMPPFHHPVAPMLALAFGIHQRVIDAQIIGGLTKQVRSNTTDQAFLKYRLADIQVLPTPHLFSIPT